MTALLVFKFFASFEPLRRPFALVHVSNLYRMYLLVTHRNPINVNKYKEAARKRKNKARKRVRGFFYLKFVVDVKGREEGPVRQSIVAGPHVCPQRN